jgi:hypothetical protein
MSPEQARGKPLDKRSDVWSFGYVLFEMLTGQAPFAGETLSDTLAVVLHREPDLQRLPDAVPVRVLRSGKAAVFCGRVLSDEAAPAPRQLYLLDLGSGAERPLAPDIGYRRFFVQIAITPDDQQVLTALPAGDLQQIVAVPLAGEGRTRPVLTMTRSLFGIDVGPDGSLFLDQFDRPREVLRFAPTGGKVERVLSGGSLAIMQPVEFPDGRVLLPSTVSGVDRLVVARVGQEAAPLLPAAMETAPPVTLVGEDRVALLTGAAGQRQLAIVSIARGPVRILHHLKHAPANDLSNLTASPDGRVLYYVHAKQVWRLPSDGSAAPERIGAGDSVAVDPDGRALIVQRLAQDAVHLVRIPVEGGEERPIRVVGKLRVAPTAMGGRAAGKLLDGRTRILLAAAAPDSWFWRAALLDIEGGELEPIPADYEGDIYPVNWGRGGQVVGFGYGLRSDLWRFQPNR